MGTNTFNNAVRITKSAMEWLENNTVFPKYVNTTYKSEFEADGAKGGDTINVRVPGFYSVRTGAAAVPQGYNDSYVPVALTQYGVDLKFTSAQLKLNMEDGEAFKRNVLGPMCAPLASAIDALCPKLYTSCNQFTGVPGTALADLDYFLKAGAILDDNAAPRDGLRSAVLSPWSQASVVQGLKGLFHSSSEISKQYDEGTMGMAAGLKFSMDQNIQNHTVGASTSGTPDMNGSTAEGAAVIVTHAQASSASTYAVGDIVSIAGVYAVNPITKAVSSNLMQFRVKTAVTSSSADCTIAIDPPIYASTTQPLQNVNALPQTGALVYKFGVSQHSTYSGLVSPANLVFHRDAFALVTVDLPKPESAVFATRIKSRNLNISMRLIQYYNGNDDSELYRLDILAGAALVRPGFCVRVQG